MKMRMAGLTLALCLAAGPSFAQFAEKFHAGYDADLGWANRPRVDLPAFYGPGLDFRTNAQGFRNDRDFPLDPPDGKRRVLCSGDSFALGYGVGQRQSWCAQLEDLDPSLETVNMGQGGYGVDQSYLWFMRDGRRLHFQAHLFTFTFTDFERMKSADFFGYKKPTLAVVDGRLTATPAAAPDPDFRLPRLTSFRIWLHGFAWVRDLEDWARKRWLRVEDPRIERLCSKIFESLKAENAVRGSRLTVVYLPTPFDREPSLLDDLRSYLRAELARQGIAFVDLTARLRALDRRDFEALFLSPDAVKFTGAAGHYSAEGNRRVAEWIHEAAFERKETGEKSAPVRAA